MKQQVATLCPLDPSASVANLGKDGDLSTKTDRWAVIIISCTICILECLHLCSVSVIVYTVTRFGHGVDLDGMRPAVRISVFLLFTFQARLCLTGLLLVPPQYWQFYNIIPKYQP